MSNFTFIMFRIVYFKTQDSMIRNQKLVRIRKDAARQIETKLISLINALRNSKSRRKEQINARAVTIVPTYKWMTGLIKPRQSPLICDAKKSAQQEIKLNTKLSDNHENHILNTYKQPMRAQYERQREIVSEIPAQSPSFPPPSSTSSFSLRKF